MSPLEEQCGQQKTNLRGRKFFTRRWVLAYLLCIVRVCQAALRQCIGMALVCMTHKETSGAPTVNSGMTSNNSAGVGNLTNLSNLTLSEKAEVGRGGEFAFSSALEGHVLVAYYYGFLLTVLTAGYVDQWLGPVRTIALGVGAGGVVNLLTPELTRRHAYLLVALRVLAGCANGLIDPSIHTLWTHWAPITERGQLTAVDYAGVSVGGVLTFLISAFLCQIPHDNGWPFVFYFYGAVSLVFTAVWLWLAKTSPETHPTITRRERDHIVSNRSEISRDSKINPPWLKILTSGAVYAIIVAHASFSWVYSWILAYLPMFMADVLHYSIAQNGLMSSAPFLGKLVIGVAGGYLADNLLRRHLSIIFVRKAFQIAGSVGCAVPLLVICFLSSEQRVVAVVMLVVSVSLQNLTSVAYRINSLDIAPRYAGFLMGMTSTIACALTLTAPYITSALLVTKSREEWQRVLYIVTAVSVAGGVVFLVCAKGHLQEWARDQTTTCIEVVASSSSPNKNQNFLLTGNGSCAEPDAQGLWEKSDGKRAKSEEEKDELMSATG